MKFMKYIIISMLVAFTLSASAQEITTFPYLTGFEGQVGTLNENYPVGWSSEDLNVQPFGNQGWQIIKNSPTSVNARTDSTAVHMFSHASETNDDWLFTPSIQMEAGQTYTMTFWMKVNLFGNTAEKLKVHASTTASASNMLTGPALWDNNNITNSDYELQTVSFTPNNTGIYYFGFHYYSAEFQYILLLDDVTIDVQNTQSIAELSSSEYDMINPAGNELYILLKNPMNKRCQLNLYSISGELIRSEVMFPASRISSDISGLRPGIYSLELVGENGRRLISDKLIKN